jgi:hypothetical protein
VAILNVVMIVRLSVSRECQQDSQESEENLDVLADGLGLALKYCVGNEAVRSKLEESGVAQAVQLEEKLLRHIRRVFHPDDPDDEDMAGTIICPFSTSVTDSRPPSPLRSRPSSPSAWSETTEGTVFEECACREASQRHPRTTHGVVLDLIGWVYRIDSSLDLQLRTHRRDVRCTVFVMQFRSLLER